MKSMDEIIRLPRLIIIQKSTDGFHASAVLQSSVKMHRATVICSWGGGWDHVSVSYSNRIPTWDKMAEVKRLLFEPDEVCYQLHPQEDEYVNNNSHCLHIWRPQHVDIPTPPSWMVGVRVGETLHDTIKAAAEYMRKYKEMECVSYEAAREALK